MNVVAAVDGVYLVDVFISEYSASNQNLVTVMRGKMPILKWVAQRPVLSDLSILNNGSKSYIFKDVAIGAENSGGDENLGQIAFQLT